MYSTSRGITARSSTTPSGRKLWTRSVTLGKRLFAMLLLLFCRFFRDFCFWCKFWAVVCLVFGFARREKQNQIKSQLSVVYRLDAGRRSCRSHEFPQKLLIVFAQFYVFLVFFFHFFFKYRNVNPSKHFPLNQEFSNFGNVPWFSWFSWFAWETTRELLGENRSVRAALRSIPSDLHNILT